MEFGGTKVSSVNLNCTIKTSFTHKSLSNPTASPDSTVLIQILTMKHGQDIPNFIETNEENHQFSSDVHHMP